MGALHSRQIRLSVGDSLTIESDEILSTWLGQTLSGQLTTHCSHMAWPSTDWTMIVWFQLCDYSTRDSSSNKKFELLQLLSRGYWCESMVLCDDVKRVIQSKHPARSSDLVKVSTRCRHYTMGLHTCSLTHEVINLSVLFDVPALNFPPYLHCRSNGLSGCWLVWMLFI